jgi:carbon monoxide dehydrogenase subunit G
LSVAEQYFPEPFHRPETENMTMEIASDFQLHLPADEAYELLLDLERVAPCMPGATLGDEREDGARDLTVTVRLGPMKFSYNGTVRLSERDDAARQAVLVGAAQEARGQGTANATITMTVTPEGERSSRVDSVAVVQLTGRAAQTGRGIVEDVSRRMVAQMAACLAEKTAAPAAPAAEPPVAAGAPTAEAPVAAATAPDPAPAPAPASAPPAPARPAEIKAGSLLTSILWERIRRLFRRRG